jgi:hypothetical protein
MKKVKSLVFNTFIVEGEDGVDMSQSTVDSLISTPYTEELGYGFSQIMLEENVLTAVLLKRTPTFIQDYDDNIKELTRKQINLFSSVKFTIDFVNNLITVQGGSTQMNVIKSVFRSVLNFNYQSDPIIFNATSFYERLYEKGISTKIQQITVKGFIYNNGMVGRYSGEVISQSVGAEIIKLYNSNIVKISFKIDLPDNDFLILQVFPNGSIKFLTEESEFEYYLQYVKTLIFD